MKASQLTDGWNAFENKHRNASDLYHLSAAKLAFYLGASVAVKIMALRDETSERAMIVELLRVVMDEIPIERTAP